MLFAFPFSVGAEKDAARGLVLGYYVPYDSTSWVSLQAHADRLDFIAAQWVSIDACGYLGSRDDQTLKGFARVHGIRLVPSLFTISGWLNHQLLTDDETSAHAIEQIVGYVVQEDYAGFDLDLEAVDASDRPALSAFVQTLADALHSERKLLTLAIPAKEREVTIGWAGAYDYAALGAAADLVTIMAYEFRGPFSGPGSVAPYGWVQRVAAFTASQIPPEKVLLGLAFYGYDWNTTSGGTRSLGYSQALALAERYGPNVNFDPVQQSLTFMYSSVAGDAVVTIPPRVRLNHRVTARTPPACGLEPPPSPPAPAPTPTPGAGTPQEHEVWVEDSGSVAVRLSLADRYGLRGVSAWRLGLEDPGVWPVFEDWRAADTTASGS